MNNLKINHLAILVCTILLFALGFAWYGPLFGERWMAMVNIDMETVEANPPGAGVWIVNLLATLAPLYLLAWLFTKLSITSGVRGAVIGFLITFCFHQMPTIVGNMFAQAPDGLAWITGGFDLVGLTVSGFILGAWTKKV